MEENKSSEHINGDEIVLQVGAGKNAQQYDNNGKPASPNQQENYNKQELTANIGRSSPEYESRSSSSAKKDKVDNELIESAKVEIHEVMEENQRLKTYLDRVLKDYRNLQMQYRDVIKQEALKSPSVTTTISADDTRNYHHDQVEEPELISLSLGRGSSDTMRDDPPRKNGKVDTKGLTLGLDCKMEDFHTQLEPKSLDPSPENSVEEVKEQAGETWTPNNKTTKNARDEGDDEISPQNPAKKARVSVRVRCDTPTMNDGCQWRKYGQKIAKGNPCPRAYYRCTVAPQCPVRKQVQRCAEDMSILITTYEGTHNHPLPVSATAMASTTSAAASMLLSDSSTSASGPSSSSSTSAAMTSANINGLNFYLSDNSRPKPFYLPNSSISSSSSYPTITLDLTSSSSSSSASHFNRLPSLPPRYSTTNLNFSSLESNALPISWSNGVLTSYASHQPLNTNQTTSNSLNFGGHENNFHSYLKPNNQQSLAPDTIEAATKAIASDPSFRSALAAAISSLISPGAASTTTATATNTPGYNLSIRDKASQNINSSTEPFPILSSFPSSSNNVNKCTPSYLNKSSSTSSSSTQPGNLMFLSPSFPFSNSRSKSNSPGDSRDHKVV